MKRKSIHFGDDNVQMCPLIPNLKAEDTLNMIVVGSDSKTKIGSGNDDDPVPIIDKPPNHENPDPPKPTEEDKDEEED